MKSECTCEHPIVRHAEGELLGHPGKHPCTVFGCGCIDFERAEAVHLPKLIADEFQLSTSEARRLQVQGAVKIDGATPLSFDYPRHKLKGKTLTVGKRRSVEL